MDLISKIYALSLRSSGVDVTEELLEISRKEIAADHRYTDFINMMSVYAGDLRDNSDGAVVPIKYQGSSDEIFQAEIQDKRKKLKRITDVWRCNIPSKSTFSNWEEGSPKKGNNGTCRFIVLYFTRIRCHGKEFNEGHYDILMREMSTSSFISYINRF